MGSEQRKKSRNKAEREFEEFLGLLTKKNKLEVLGSDPRTIYSRRSFRLDMQKVTDEGWDLQIQPNKESEVIALAVLLETVSTVIVPRSADGGVGLDPEEIIQQFRANSVFKQLRDGQTDLETLGERSKYSSMKSLSKITGKVRDTKRRLARAFKRDAESPAPE